MLRSSHDACGCSTQTTSTINLKRSTLHPHEGQADRPNTPSDSVKLGSKPETPNVWVRGANGRRVSRGAINWTRLSCRSFAANAVRLQLHALAYNLGNFMRALAMPKTAQPWSLTSLREKLIKIGAKVVSHARYTTFQMAEVAVPRQMFQEILTLIARLRPPAPA